MPCLKKQESSKGLLTPKSFYTFAENLKTHRTTLRL